MYKLFTFKNGNVAMVQNSNSKRLAIAVPDGRNANISFRDQKISKTDVKFFFRKYFNKITFDY